MISGILTILQRLPEFEPGIRGFAFANFRKCKVSILVKSCFCSCLRPQRNRLTNIAGCEISGAGSMKEYGDRLVLPLRSINKRKIERRYGSLRVVVLTLGLDLNHQRILELKVPEMRPIHALRSRSLRCRRLVLDSNSHSEQDVSSRDDISRNNGESMEALSESRRFRQSRWLAGKGTRLTGHIH